MRVFARRDPPFCFLVMTKCFCDDSCSETLSQANSRVGRTTVGSGRRTRPQDSMGAPLQVDNFRGACRRPLAPVLLLAAQPPRHRRPHIFNADTSLCQARLKSTSIRATGAVGFCAAPNDARKECAHLEHSAWLLISAQCCDRASDVTRRLKGL